MVNPIYADSGILFQFHPYGNRSSPLPRLGDFTTDRRVVTLMGMAAFVGAGGVASAYVLLRAIALVTNLVWFHTLSFQSASLANAKTNWWMVAAPAFGGLAIGLLARFGSEKIRGHGIPEAIEAILIGQSRMSPKVAILKPLSSAISIGTGGPFGAEGPIIMTGGALGSLFAQCFSLSAAERKTLLVAGAAAGMTAIFGTPIAAVLLAVELLLFEWKPRSLIPVITACAVAAALRPLVIGSGALFPFSGTLALSGWDPRHLRWRRRRRRTAIGSADRLALQGRRPLRRLTDPLDVVASAGRPGRRPRRLDRAKGARRRL